MTKPLIGIAVTTQPNPPGTMPYDQYYINEAYRTSVVRAGGVPLVLIDAEKEEIARLVSLVDGILLPGGRDIDPSFYQEEKRELCGPTKPEGDVFQFQVFEEARRQHKPILGICRGCQLVNVALGGSLYQDFQEREGSRMPHRHREKYDQSVHDILIQEGSLLHQLLGTTRIGTNSIHHQVIRKVGEGLRVSATTEDGSIEAIEGENILAVQFHPEAFVMRDSSMLPLFSWLVRTASHAQ